MVYVHIDMVDMFSTTCPCRDKKKFLCSKCGIEVLLEDLFRDKAVERELKRLEFLYLQAVHVGRN